MGGSAIVYATSFCISANAATYSPSTITRGGRHEPDVFLALADHSARYSDQCSVVALAKGPPTCSIRLSAKEYQLDDNPSDDREMQYFEAEFLKSVRVMVREEIARAHFAKSVEAPFARRGRETGPRVAINMLVPKAVAARFIAFCGDNRYTYWEGIDELLKRATGEARNSGTGSPVPPSIAEPAARRQRTGRNQQINIKATPEVIARFYALAEANGWTVAGAFERAVDALHES